jgi:hypothetical protein
MFLRSLVSGSHSGQSTSNSLWYRKAKRHRQHRRGLGILGVLGMCGGAREL